MLSIEKTELTYASWFEDTSNLRLGASVICIGNPLGTLPGSVSTGVISYPNREVQVDDYQTMELIQTDVAINSGNSGGGQTALRKFAFPLTRQSILRTLQTLQFQTA